MSRFPQSIPECYIKIASIRVRSLSIVLLDLDVGLSEKDISDQQLGEIRNILDGCYNVLFEIETLLEKNLELESSDRRLANRARRVWKKVNWRPEDVHELRNRLTSHITMLNAFVCRISRLVGPIDTKTKKNKCRYDSVNLSSELGRSWTCYTKDKRTKIGSIFSTGLLQPIIPPSSMTI